VNELRIDRVALGSGVARDEADAAPPRSARGHAQLDRDDVVDGRRRSRVQRRGGQDGFPSVLGEENVEHECDEDSDAGRENRVRDVEEMHTARDDQVGEPHSERDARSHDPAAGRVAERFQDVADSVSEHHQDQARPAHHVDHVEDQHDLCAVLSERWLAEVDLLDPVALAAERERHGHQEAAEHVSRDEAHDAFDGAHEIRDDAAGHEAPGRHRVGKARGVRAQELVLALSGAQRQASRIAFLAHELIARALIEREIDRAHPGRSAPRRIRPPTG